MERLQIQGMDGVDAVLALLRGCRDVNVLREVAGVLEIDLQGVGDDRRRILREISNVIDSEDFENRGEQADQMINEIHAMMNAHFVADLPEPPQNPQLEGDVVVPLGQQGPPNPGILLEMDPFQQGGAIGDDGQGGMAGAFQFGNQDQFGLQQVAAQAADVAQAAAVAAPGAGPVAAPVLQAVPPVAQLQALAAPAAAQPPLLMPGQQPAPRRVLPALPRAAGQQPPLQQAPVLQPLRPLQQPPRPMQQAPAPPPLRPLQQPVRPPPGQPQQFIAQPPGQPQQLIQPVPVANPPPAQQWNHLHGVQHPGYVLPPAPAPVQAPGVQNYFYPPGAAAAAGTGGVPQSPFSPVMTPLGAGIATGGPTFTGGSGRSQVARWKELKISGQIGSPGQKDKLTYTGLSFQIGSARARGFEDMDICAAVIKAIAPGEELRTYLEMCPTLTLDTLIPVLRMHFKEKDATLVYTELSNGAQGPSETENDFCLRMMALRQKVLLMSQEENGQYTPQLVQTQFQKSLSTGFRREAVRQQLRGVLKNPIHDIQLLQEIRDVVMTETEHDSKVKVAKVAAANHVNAEPAAPPKTQNQKQGNPILAEITKLTSQISELSGLHSGLQSQMDALRQSSYTPPANPAPPGPTYPSQGPGNQPTNQGTTPVIQDGNGRGRGGRGRGRGGRGGNRGFGRRMGCFQCVQAGLFCNHCYTCGEENHKFFECPVSHAIRETENEGGNQS